MEERKKSSRRERAGARRGVFIGNSPLLNPLPAVPHGARRKLEQIK
jgi:hypothetical protein